MSGFTSAKRNIARHEITVWMLHYGGNHAVHQVSIALLDSNSSVVALTCLKCDCSMISSLMITDSTPNMSGYEIKMLRGTYTAATVNQVHDVMFLKSNRARSKHMYVQRQLETDLT